MQECIRFIDPAANALPATGKSRQQVRLLRQGKVRNAMAGSPDAVAFRIKAAMRSLSPSCSWLSGLA
jgi:hypothetical protein